MGLNSEVRQQVRQLLAAGYRVGSEHADARRFQTSSWKSCSPTQANHESEVIAALEACLAEHPGEYVRMFGIDPKAKRRVSELMIQRPGDQATQAAPQQNHQAASSSAATTSRQASAGTGSDVYQQVQQLLNQGYRVGTEYADKRRYQTSSWRSGPSLSANGAAAAIAELEAFLAEHPGEYVRLIGVEPKAKRRVLEMLIQQPNGQVSQNGKKPGGQGFAPSSSSSRAEHTTSQRLPASLLEQLQQWLNNGYHIGTEHADARRFQTSSWHSCSPIRAQRAGDAVAALEACMQEHQGEYVRMFGIDPKAKRRMSETIIQRPGDQAGNHNGTATVAAPQRAAAAPSRPTPSARQSQSYSANNASKVSQDVVEQVQQLINQGKQLSTEFADKRRYQTSSWKSGGLLPMRSTSEAIAALESAMADHQDEYVRLIGIDPVAKRRVLETIVQRPSR